MTTKRKARAAVVPKFDLDTKVAEQIAVAMRRWRATQGPLVDLAGEPAVGLRLPSVVAIDGGSASAGWCFLNEYGASRSGQGTPLEVEEAVINATSGDPSPVLFVREGPYTVSTQQMVNAKSGGPMMVYRLGVAAGFITRGIFPVIRHAAMWEPMPTSWRSVVGCNRQKTATRTAKENTTDAVLEYARRAVDRPLTTTRGRDCVDEAMAIGMACAGRAICRAVERTSL